MISDVLALCEQLIGYEFTDKQLLEICLTHASGARSRLESNERLEFLGDSILGAVVCDQLYRQFPESTEGELTRIKSEVVSRATCAILAREIGLHQVVKLGKGIDRDRDLPDSILAGVFEAIIAGIYYDAGFEVAKGFVSRLTDGYVRRIIENQGEKNSKSILQQLSQKRFGETPIYALLEERGPDHSKHFQVAAMVGRRQFAPAWGTNKKEAEQRAAANALLEIEAEPGVTISDVPSEELAAPATRV